MGNVNAFKSLTNIRILVQLRAAAACMQIVRYIKALPRVIAAAAAEENGKVKGFARCKGVQREKNY